MKKTILYVEDDLETSRIISSVLQKSYETIHVGDGLSALAVSNLQSFHMILLDVGLPKFTGFQFLSKLRQNPSYNHTPIIFISANSNIESRLKGLSMGAMDFIPKPVNLRELLIKIDNIFKMVEYRPIKKHVHPFISKLRQALEYDLTKTRLRDIAERMHYSESAVKLNVKTYSGISFSQYVHQYKLEKAHLLLQEGGDTIEQVATQSGFKSITHFHRVYKEKYGCRASETRKNHILS